MSGGAINPVIIAKAIFRKGLVDSIPVSYNSRVCFVFLYRIK